ncbi:MAG: hypothetical protein HC906_00400 [Bacteroidales bacterium]|nr:hypothetical protein [Bacteroidales bacterium]
MVHELSKHDGPVSVLRGFTDIELNNILKRAWPSNYTILKRWPFRYLIVCVKV